MSAEAFLSMEGMDIQALRDRLKQYARVIMDLHNCIGLPNTDQYHQEVETVFGRWRETQAKAHKDIVEMQDRWLGSSTRVVPITTEVIPVALDSQISCENKKILKWLEVKLRYCKYTISKLWHQVVGLILEDIPFDIVTFDMRWDKVIATIETTRDRIIVTRARILERARQIAPDQGI